MRLALVGFASLIVAACGGDATVGSSGTGGAGNTGGNSSTTTSNTGGGANTGGSAAGGNGQGGASMACGGLLGGSCDAASYCDYPDNLCGALDGTGMCTPRPDSCTEEFDPTCACDGQIHDNPCMAAVAGFDTSNLGDCPVAQGFFACGSKICNVADSYCQHFTDDTGGPDSYGCFPLNCPVAVPTCDCITQQTADCGGMCEVLMSGGVVLHCPGG